LTRLLRTRLATATDQAALRALWALYEAAMRGHIEAIWGWDPAWQAADFSQAYAKLPTYLIERDGATCGYLQLELRPDDVYVRMLIVAPEARSQGIGAAVLAALVARAARAGRTVCLRVFRINQAAYRFYQRAGWRLEWADQAFYVMRSPDPVSTAPMPITPADLLLTAPCV